MAHVDEPLTLPSPAKPWPGPLPLDAPRDRYVTVRLPRELVERIDPLAAARGWSRRHWVVRALERVAAGEEAKH
jgi:hypothetical protein